MVLKWLNLNFFLNGLLVLTLKLLSDIFMVVDVWQQGMRAIGEVYDLSSVSSRHFSGYPSMHEGKRRNGLNESNGAVELTS